MHEQRPLNPDLPCSEPVRLTFRPASWDDLHPNSLKPKTLNLECGTGHISSASIVVYGPWLLYWNVQIESSTGRHGLFCLHPDTVSLPTAPTHPWPQPRNKVLSAQAYPLRIQLSIFLLPVGATLLFRVGTVNLKTLL